MKRFHLPELELPVLEETDHPIERSLQGLAIGAATMGVAFSLLALTANLHNQSVAQITKAQAKPPVESTV